MAWEIALVITFLGTAFGLFYIGSNTNEDHYPLKLFLLLIGLFLLLGNIAVTNSIVDANNETIGAEATEDISTITDTAYSGFIWVVVFTVFYFIIYFIIMLFNGMRLKNGK